MLMSSEFLSHSPPYFFLTGSSIEPRGHRQTGLISQQIPRITPVSAREHYYYDFIMSMFFMQC